MSQPLSQAGGAPAADPPTAGGGAPQPPAPSPSSSKSESDVGARAENDAAARARKLERQLKERDAELAQFKQRDAEAEKAKLSQLELSNRERDEWKAKAIEGEQARKKDRIQAEFRLKALEAHCKDPDLAAMAADLTACKVEDDGSISGVADALNAVKSARGFLFGPSTPTAPVGSGGGNTGQLPAGGTTYTADQLKAMPDAEFRKVFAQVQAGTLKLS